MLSIFMIIIILIGGRTIHYEVKTKERGEKIFYTFYTFVLSTIIFPLFGIFDSIVAYIIFLMFYIFLLYGIYTDFEAFTHLSEIFLRNKKIEKKELVKIDYEFLNLLLKYYKKMINTYTINSYNTAERIMDNIFIIIGTTAILLVLFTKII